MGSLIRVRALCKYQDIEGFHLWLPISYNQKFDWCFYAILVSINKKVHMYAWQCVKKRNKLYLLDIFGVERAEKEEEKQINSMESF